MECRNGRGDPQCILRPLSSHIRRADARITVQHFSSCIAGWRYLIDWYPDQSLMNEKRFKSTLADCHIDKLHYGLNATRTESDSSSMYSYIELFECMKLSDISSPLISPRIPMIFMHKILLPYLAKTPTPRSHTSPPSLPIASPDGSVTKIFRRNYCTTQVSGQFLPSRHVRTGYLRATLINITPSIRPESIGTGEALHSSDNESIGA
nr:hypothetical protein CFP56_78264 [Quercus suber]